jgi:hypothetical protein
MNFGDRGAAPGAGAISAILASALDPGFAVARGRLTGRDVYDHLQHPFRRYLHFPANLWISLAYP